MKEKGGIFVVNNRRGADEVLKYLAKELNSNATYLTIEKSDGRLKVTAYRDDVGA